MSLLFLYLIILASLRARVSREARYNSPPHLVALHNTSMSLVYWLRLHQLTTSIVIYRCYSTIIVTTCYYYYIFFSYHFYNCFIVHFILESNYLSVVLIAFVSGVHIVKFGSSLSDRQQSVMKTCHTLPY